MIRVLVIVNDLNAGGTEKHLLSVLPRVSRQEIQVQVYSLLSSGLLTEAMQAQGIKVVSPKLPAFFKLKAFKYFFSATYLFAYLKNQQPDIVHCFLPRAYLIGGLVAVLAGCNKVAMSRRGSYSPAYQKTFYFKLEKLMHRYLHSALACSKSISRQLGVEGIANHKIQLIYNGVDTEYFCVAEDRVQRRKLLGLSANQFVMVIVANLYAYKGHADLLLALGRIKQDLPQDWVLLAVGHDAGEYAKLQAMTLALGLNSHVRWLGGQQEARKFMAAADVGVLCSHTEGFSNALLESMACGLPMVVTDVSGSNEAILQNYNGLIVPPKSPVELAVALLKLAQSPELRLLMSKNTVQRVREKFSLTQTVAGYVNFYRTMAAS